jgi:hypothetical protein
MITFAIAAGGDEGGEEEEEEEEVSSRPAFMCSCDGAYLGILGHRPHSKTMVPVRDIDD